MSNRIVTKNLTNLEVLNIYNYINRCNKNKQTQDESVTYPMLKLLNQFGVKAKWAFHVNLKKLEEVVNLYNSILKEIQVVYSDDEHSTESNTDNNEIKTRIVKDEYLTEYRNKIQELLNQENEISIKTINIDDISDVNLDFADLEILSFMIDDE